MKRILAAGVALAMGTAVAHASDFGGASTDPSILSAQPFSGHMELYGQAVWQDYWSDYYSPYKGIGGASRINWAFAPGMSAQFDLAGQFAADAYYAEYSTFSLYGAAHLNKRTDTHLLGIFGGVSGTSDYEGYYGWDTSLFGGVEGQLYNGPFTLYAQIGWIGQIAGYYGPTYNPSYTFGYLFGQVEARYFITPNTKLAANLGFVSGAVWGYYGGQTTVSYGAEIEHRLASNPFSFFGRVQGFNSTYTGMNVYRVTAGLRLNFGSSSLFDQDRNGATLKVMEDLAPVGDLRAFD